MHIHHLIKHFQNFHFKNLHLKLKYFLTFKICFVVFLKNVSLETETKMFEKKACFEDVQEVSSAVKS